MKLTGYKVAIHSKVLNETVFIYAFKNANPIGIPIIQPNEVVIKQSLITSISIS